MNTTKFTDLPLLISKAKASQFVLECLSHFDAEDIDSDSVDLRFEVDDVDTGSTVSIVDECGQAAESILALVEALESAQPKADIYDMLREDYNLTGSLAEFVDWQAKRIAELEARTVNLPKPIQVKLTGGEYVNAWTAYTVDSAIRATGIKCEVKWE